MLPTLSAISEPRIVLRRLKGAAALVTSAASPDDLPADLLRQASRRLRVMALMAAVPLKKFLG